MTQTNIFLLSYSFISVGVFGGFPKDLRLPKFFPIPSRTRRIYVPFQIIDDNINEGSQKVGLYLVKKPQNVFEVDTTMVMLTIEDNDGKYCFYNKTLTKHSNITVYLALVKIWDRPNYK